MLKEPTLRGHSSRSWPRPLRQAIAFLALLSSLALLVADSAEPECASAEPLPFTVYDIDLACSGASSGRIRLAATFDPVTEWQVDFETIDGDAKVTLVDIYGRCMEEGGVAEPVDMVLHMVGSTCTINLETDLGDEVQCAGHTAESPCTIIVEGVE